VVFSAYAAANCCVSFSLFFFFVFFIRLLLNLSSLCWLTQSLRVFSIRKAQERTKTKDGRMPKSVMIYKYLFTHKPRLISKPINLFLYSIYSLKKRSKTYEWGGE